ncbi:hypothetical protein AZ66_27095 [Paenibacillus sp. E194]|uniref:WIAG-tail domain n=1 Tax=Paenibacillus sp. E194 TaxID=1458845 RepID=UPI0005C7FC22|nr:WIAG-tail domain [Paenibacillus sp. E194]KJB85051.1 hypothetical protein AZ66_27095 [Paenibacillus sp. E194]
MSHGAITAEHVSQGAIGPEHVSQGAISSEHVSLGVITPEHCTFSSIRTTSTRTSALQQFGMSSFAFRELDEKIELTIQFEEAYPHENYVFVAMTNHSSCYAVLKSQFADHVVIEIIRIRIGPQPEGSVSWIVIG